MTRPDSPQPARTGLAADILGTALSILKGLWVTHITFWRPKVTVQYPHRSPAEDYKPRPGYRGDFALLTDRETGALKCTACMSCARICPDKCIHIEGEGKGKERKPTVFIIDLGLCMFCHLCVEACPFDALTMTPDYEQAEYSPRALIRDLDRLTARGLEFDEVQRVKTVCQPESAAPESGTDPQ